MGCSFFLFVPGMHRNHSTQSQIEAPGVSPTLAVVARCTMGHVSLEPPGLFLRPPTYTSNHACCLPLFWRTDQEHSPCKLESAMRCDAMRGRAVSFFFGNYLLKRDVRSRILSLFDRPVFMALVFCLLFSGTHRANAGPNTNGSQCEWVLCLQCTQQTVFGSKKHSGIECNIPVDRRQPRH